MDQAELTQLVRDHISGTTFALPAALLRSAQVDALAGDFFPNSALTLHDAAERATTDANTVIRIHGTGTFAPLRDLPVDLDFWLINGQAALRMVATAGAGWGLGSGLPPFQHTLVGDLVFSGAPQITLRSHPEGSSTPGAHFEGVLDLAKMSGGLSALAGQNQLPLAGEIVITENGSLLYYVDLQSPPMPPVDLWVGTVEDLTVTVGNELARDTRRNTYSARPYMLVAARLPFTAQGVKRAISLETQISALGDSFRLRADVSDVGKAALDELGALTSQVSLASMPLPGGVTLEQLIELDEFYLDVDLQYAKKITLIGLGVKSTHQWELLQIARTGRKVTIGELRARMLLYDPFDAQGRQGVMQISGELAIGAGVVHLAAQAPGWLLQGALKPGTSIQLADLLGMFFGTSADVPPMTIDELEITLSPQHYQLALELDGHWPLPVNGLDLVIESVACNLAYRAGSDPTFAVYGIFAVGGVDVMLGASYPGGGAGWQFSGRTGPGQAIPIGELLADLAHMFGANTPPATLAGLVISDLSVSFDTKLRHFTFGCRAQFPIGSHAGDAVGVEVMIDVQPDGAGYRTLFGGTMNVAVAELPAPLVFDLRLAAAPASTTFLAAYSHSGGAQRLKLAALLRAVIAADSPEFSLVALVGDIEIDLKDVLLAYRRTQAASGNAPQQGKFLFGLDLGVDLSLSNLPLIGQHFPPEERFGVETLRVLLASAAFTATEAGELNALLPPGIAALPADDSQGALARGAQVSAVLRLGSQGQRTLAMPLAGSTAPTPPAPRDAVVVSSDTAKWFDLQKSFGPVHFERVGVEYREQALRFLLDAALSMAGLTLALDGLSFGSPIDHFAPVFDLRGLGISYRNDPVEISGALLRIPASANQPDDEYDGAAVIRTAKFSLAALGSYTTIAGHPSLFIYALLDQPIGGPAFFFVTGLAAGFGYNRRVVVPPVEQVGSFPLVAAAQNAAPITGAQNPAALLKSTLASFRTSLPPADNALFFAAGIRFTSFKVIDSFALLIVSLDDRFRIDLLGLSTMVSPPDVGAGVTPLAEMQLALKASFVPDEGFLGVSSQLTSESYLFSRACHLTGGFAFYAWFAGPHSGDFALTLGGYHPAFQAPAHYPRVPRLGFNWNYSDALTIKGDAYFALTPAALMAGGHLEVNWHSGDLRAWFNAGADFLIGWKPYHYDARVFVDVGADYTFWFFGTHHLSVHVGADLHIWGPEFAGTAHIQLSIISFDVAFGARSRPEAQLIEWADFKRAFLPEQVLGVALQAGLIQKRSDAGLDLGLIEPQQLVLATNTLVPFTEAQIGGQPVQHLATLYATGTDKPALTPLARGDAGYAPSQPTGARAQPVGLPAVGAVGVLPPTVIGPQPADAPEHNPGTRLKSSYSVTITRGGKPAEQEFVFTPITKPVPAAMWGQLDAQLKPRLDAEALVQHTLAGFEIRPAAPAQGAHTAPLPLAKLGHPAGIAGALQFFQYHLPPLGDGTYTVTISQQVASTGDPANLPRRIPADRFDTSTQFTVAAARLTLAPGDVQSLFPPEGSLGDHANVLPHVVLSASALPWMQPGAPSPAHVPWLALLLFDETEAPAVRVASLAALRDPKQLPAEFPLAAFPSGSVPTAQLAGDKLAVIDVPQKRLAELLPAPAELALLAHVRQPLDSAGQPAGEPVAVVIANRLPHLSRRSTAHLVVVAGLFPNGTLEPGALPASGLVRFVSLKSWSFACTSSEQNLQGLLNGLNRRRAVLTPDTTLPRIMAGGEQGSGLYHGPCVAAPAPLARALPVHAARELVLPSARVPDLSYAAAWELGRMLALQNQSVALGLYHWKRARAQLRKSANTPSYLPFASPSPEATILPPAVLSWCADLMMLKGLPFNYLVPNEAMLPREALRFFSIDRGWLDCLLDGVFSVGRVTTLGQQLEAELLAEFGVAVWEYVAALQQAAQKRPDVAAIADGGGDTTAPLVLSGVLLRSDAVAGWPGLLVQAHSAAGEPLAEMRREQLSPNVLLLVCAGEVAEIGIYQKPESLHFGFDTPDQEHTELHKENQRDDGTDATVAQVPWDAGTGIVQIGELARRMAGKVGEAELNSAQFARWMIEQTPHISIARPSA